MIIRADEHVSPFIVAAIRDIAIRDGWEITSIHEVGDSGSSDVHWITNFANEGGHAILTADKDFVILEPQINAVFDTGLKVIHLPPKWGNFKGYLQAAHILQWWDRIELTLEAMSSRECYRPPWNIKETGELKKVDINFSKAQKKRKRKSKRQK
ncbi:DUF5615 family PIN-like protein [Fodinicurvata fenggangensis]|uniref:DUF5615 family PIN-like protein n=1 Tax=Fodinicurvata fenggangensis TaxID=1121830 RepID=UPI000478C153|nr:DUF5615 family PIN-like protein [Fodinicurvata fenggangensis]